MTINPQNGTGPVTPARSANGGRATFRVSSGALNSRIVAGGAGTSTTVTDLTPGGSYRVAIRAYDAAGNASAWSEEISFTALTGPSPATVSVAAAIPGPTVIVPGPTPATVAASAFVATPPAGLQRTTSTAGTSTTVTGLTPNRTYYARVRAVDAAGNVSAWTEPISFTTVNASVATPDTVTASTSIASPAIGGAPPVLVAGVARPVTWGQGVLLDVTATPPGAATITGYTWTIIAGSGSLTNSTTATPTYTAPGSGTGTATVRVTVVTSNGGQASVDTTVAYGANIVAAENQLTGTARATWDLASPNLGGIDTLQGFCDGFTADRSGTVSFKIAQSDTAGWTADVYRLGYYGGNGARLYASLTPSAGQLTASQSQPAPGDADPDTVLLSADCSGWSATLTWTPPAWAPSGLYILRLNRTGGGASHVLFILRDDARVADLMVMPSDSTWNAYNAWGGMGGSMYSGNSLYLGTAVNQYDAGCARYVSYNRPVVNRGAADSGRSYGAVEWSTFFTGEYPMVRFLERNGFDAKYYGCIDAGGDPNGTHLRGNGSTRGGVKAAMMIGHNEYWSDNMRAGWELAKDRGVSIFTCASNEVFWRLVGSSMDSEGRPRVWECYKSTIASRGSTGRTQWTGTWRDPDGAGKGGNSPENSLTGTIFVVNGPDLRSMAVPFAGGYSAEPLWRHTSVASLTTGQTYTSPSQLLGFEWDTYGPAGVNTTGATYLASPHPRARYCSNVTYSVTGFVLTDAGDEYGNGNVTHRLVVHPGGAGAVCFSTGSINWAFGVDSANTYQTGADNTDDVIRQATVNMLVDMGAIPATLMSPLVQPTPTDWYPDVPTTTVAVAATIPAPGFTFSAAPAPATVAAVAAVAAPTVTRGATAQPATVTGSAAIAAPTVRLGVLPAPAAVTATAAIPSPAVAAGQAPAPATVASAATVPSPSVQTASGTTASPATLSASVSVAGSVRVGSAPIPATVAGAAILAAPTVASGSGPTPATAQGAVTVPGPTVITANIPAPAAVAAVASVPGAIAQTSTRITPATLSLGAAIPGPTVGVVTLSSPATVIGAVSLPGVSLRISSGVTVATLTGSVVIASPRQTIGEVITATASATVLGGTIPAGVSGDSISAKVS